MTEVSIEHTVKLAKDTRGIAFKKRAPRAIKAIKKAAFRLTRVDDVRVDPSVNEYVWSKGIRQVPRKIRVNFDVYTPEEGDKFVVVTHIPKKDFKGLTTIVSKGEEAE
eukprot:gnl/Dysnectes_brevis/219_a249_10069.p1 GENE.gnl/Dysnectes_brevis/219_a249_10069~~gnl/Dysnectes_brevis/219_a249_10069.p1  ORF type:complete len:108 (+),score=38.02 gnl/Dysnectes_brevis/219_a249_10069:66-389(+)